MEQHVYRPLRRYLLAVPPDQPQVQLSLAQLEALLGPRNRNGLPAWSLRGAVDIVDTTAGFHAHLARRLLTITFTRHEPAPQEPG